MNGRLQTNSRELLRAERWCRLIPPIIAQRIGAKLYSDERARRERASFARRLCTGAVFRHHTGDFHSRCVAIHGWFDWRIIAVARAVTSVGDTVVEIGANVGTETMAFSDIVGRQGKVFAFEPVPTNVDVLRANALQNRRDNIIVIQQAVSDRAGAVAFLLPDNEYMSGKGYIATGRDKKSDTCAHIGVTCCTLDQTDVGRPAFVSVDVEGCEGAVFRGGRRLISECKPVLAFEMGPSQLARFAEHAQNIVEFLGQMEYRVFRFRRRNICATPAVPDVPLSATETWLGLPSSRSGEISRINRLVLRCGCFPARFGMERLVAGGG